MNEATTLRFTLIQTDLVWQDSAKNRTQLQNLMQPLAQQTDVIILPEMFTTGFTMQPEIYAEAFDGDTLAWLKHQAAQLQAAIAGSVAMQVEGRYVNRFLWVTPQGEVEFYDKRHLFRMGNEAKHYAAGQARKVVHYRGWRILLQVCYDLRFPVFTRNRNDYDLAIFVANWPIARREAWRTLLQARALENLSYVIGVNRIGEDGNQLVYSGDSLAVDFKGELLADEPAYQPFVKTIRVDLTSLQAFKQQFPAWMDADDFQLL